MDDNYFKALKGKIELKMNELSRLQKIYIKETGACYIPGGIEARRVKNNEETDRNYVPTTIGFAVKENLRQGCTEW